MTHSKVTSPQTQESCLDSAKDKGCDQNGEQINHMASQGRERFGRRRWDVATLSWPPIACPLGLKTPPPFAKVQHYFHILSRTLFI